MGCGLIFCQQNSKLGNCTFCTLPFDTKPKGTDRELEKALNLQKRLLEADSNSMAMTSVKEEYTSIVQTKFCSASDIIARKREIEAFKMKLAKDQEEKSTFDLSKMLNF